MGHTVAATLAAAPRVTVAAVRHVMIHEVTRAFFATFAGLVIGVLSHGTGSLKHGRLGIVGWSLMPFKNGKSNVNSCTYYYTAHAIVM